MKTAGFCVFSVRCFFAICSVAKSAIRLRSAVISSSNKVTSESQSSILETEGYELFFLPPTEVFIYVSTIYLQSSGVIYNIEYY